MALFDSHRDAIATFPGISVSNWTVDMNTWNTTRDLEDIVRREEMDKRSRKVQTPRHMEKIEKVELDVMALDTINLDEVGKDKLLETYEKLWGASDLAHSIDRPNSYQLGLFLEAISRRQEKAMEILGTLFGEVSAYWT